jgi:putative Ca2+/H+ antiporter (TMEM165/GDT1 family)
MDWKDVAATAGKFAPLVGTLLGGPAGAAIGGLVAAALGTENTPDAIHAAIATDPAKALQLAQWEGDNKVKLTAMNFTHADNLLAAVTASIQADVEDRKSARDASVSGGTAKRLFWLSMLLLAATLGTEIGVLFFGYPKSLDAVIVGRVLGLMDAVSMLVLSFWYGSSSSSERKTELIAAAPAVPAQ